MTYKIGDIYVEKGYMLMGFNDDGTAATHTVKRYWKVIQVNTHSILCESENEYKEFKI